MRFGLTNLVFLMVLGVVGQSTPDRATRFVSSQIDSLNIKVWEQLQATKITGYSSDSLAAIVSFKEMEQRVTSTRSKWVQNPENPDDPYDLMEEMVQVPFDYKKDFNGLTLSYHYSHKDGIASFRLRGVAPLYKLVLIEGIDLGLQPLVWISVDELFSILSDEEKTFYNALFAARMQAGDFSNPYFYPSRYSDGVVAQGEDLASKSVFEDYHFHQINTQTDSVLGHYLHSLVPFAAIKAEQEGAFFYKDKNLKQRYGDIASDLSKTFEIEVPDPEHPEDPYKFVGVSLKTNFEFTSNLSYEVILVKNKEVIRFYDDEILGDNSIYIELAKLVKFMKPYDSVLLDAYLSSGD